LLRNVARFALLACASLALGIAAMSSGCLITDPPQFKLPTHTKPLLDATSANRDPAEVIVVDGNDVHTPITFSVEVTSQEDPAGTSDFDTLNARFFIDYGTPDDFKAFLHSVPTKIVTTPDGKRQVIAQWFPASQPVGSGCHRATMFVMHAVDPFTQCPTCADDYSTLTWKILRCDQTTMDDCASLPLTGDGACPELTNTCSAVLSRLADAGIEVATCPEGDSADGGTP
jgi:hypothetical protein